MIYPLALTLKTIPISFATVLNHAGSLYTRICVRDSIADRGRYRR